MVLMSDVSCRRLLQDRDWSLVTFDLHEAEDPLTQVDMAYGMYHLFPKPQSARLEYQDL